MLRLNFVAHALLAALLGMALSGCSKQAAPEAVTSPSLVRVTYPTRGPGAAPIVTTGVIASADESRLSFKLGGVVQSIAVREGEHVTRGQTLAQLVPTEINAQLTQAQQVDEKAQRDLQRGERLYADQVIALEQLQNLRTQAGITAAQLQSAKFNSGYVRITAPNDGTVLRKLVDEHEVVAPGQPVLALGANSRGYIVRAALADREVVQLQVGDTASVQLDALANKTLMGHVSVLGGAAQVENGLFPIEIQLDPSDAKLVTGLVAQITVQSAIARNSSLLYVPTSAVIAGVGQQASVYVLQGDEAHLRKVQVAFFTRDQVAISEGLTAQEQVITDGALYLRDGEKVSVQANP